MNEERIAHFMSVVKAVLVAEKNIYPKWKERLQQVKDLSEEEQIKTGDAYLRAVAIELLKNEKEGD